MLILIGEFIAGDDRISLTYKTPPLYAQDGEIFYTLKGAQVLIEKWRLEYNTFRPHSSLNYRSPAPEVYLH
jgi:transposase InsO family protein